MLFVILLGNTVSSSTCSPYLCAPADYNMPSGYCATSYNHSFFLKPCSGSEVCNLNTGLCEDPAVDPGSINYPGEPCGQNSDCSTSKCVSSTCTGTASGGYCAENEDCNPGLRCFESVCTKQIDVTQTGCVDDYDCINTAGCNFQGNSLEGTCLNYFSVDIGQVVSDCSGGVSNLCKTSECTLTNKFQTSGICKMSTTSVNTTPVQCRSYLDCVGTDNKYSYTSDCDCGYNANGTSYCKLFSGDLNAQIYYNTWKNALVASIGACNTVRRFSDECLKKIGYYDSILIASWNYYMYPEMQNNDACVSQMITYDGYSHDTAQWILVLASLYAI